MKNISELRQKLTLSELKTFHEKTKMKVFASGKASSAAWSDSRKTISYKAYPCFEQVLLPKPNLKKYDFIKALLERKSTRSYCDNPVSLADFSELIYFACGVKTVIRGDKSTKRFYPSAGARYPLEVYPFVFNVKGVSSGGYHYHVKTHSLERIVDGLLARRVFDCVDQDFVRKSNVVFVITAVFNRTEEKYWIRGYRHVFTEYGHVAQNFYLLAAAANLGCCSIGGFLDDKINSLLDLDKDDEGVIGLITVNSN